MPQFARCMCLTTYPVRVQLTGVRHKGSQCITDKLLLVKFHFFGVHFDGPWANGEGAPPLPVLDEVRRSQSELEFYTIWHR